MRRRSTRCPICQYPLQPDWFTPLAFMNRPGKYKKVKDKKLLSCAECGYRREVQKWWWEKEGKTKESQDG